MSTIGQEFHTGHIAPVKGKYTYVRHIDPTKNCVPTSEEREIPLSAGDRFPPLRSCNHGVVWRLSQFTY